MAGYGTPEPLCSAQPERPVCQLSCHCAAKHFSRVNFKTLHYLLGRFSIFTSRSSFTYLNTVNDCKEPTTDAIWIGNHVPGDIQSKAFVSNPLSLSLTPAPIPARSSEASQNQNLPGILRPRSIITSAPKRKGGGAFLQKKLPDFFKALDDKGW